MNENPPIHEPPKDRPPRRAEPHAVVKTCYYKGIPGAIDARGLAKDLTFDILVSWEGAGSELFTNCSFDNPVPPSDGPFAYPVTVEAGWVVAVMRFGARYAFWIPWLPVVQPCPSTGGRSTAERRRLALSGVPVTDGGLGTPGGVGGGSDLGAPVVG